MHTAGRRPAGHRPQTRLYARDRHPCLHADLHPIRGLRSSIGLSQADLDYLFDANANTIGALLLHLAATETYYSMNTFENKNWDSWSDDLKKNGTRR